MLQRILRSIALFVAFALLPAAASSAPEARRIVAVGDLHGDYSAWLDIARGAGLIDSRGNWTGKNTVLVQLGDVTDRGPDSLKIIRSLQKLQRTAPRAGGEVVVVVGNHEAMNLVGDLRYVDPGEFAAFVTARSPQRREEAYAANRAQIEAAYRSRDPKLTAKAIHDAWIQATPLGWAEQRAAWSPNGELGRWTRGNRAIVKIGDTVFVHGGISAEYSKVPIDEVNRRLAAALSAVDDSDNSILNDPLGPLWYRGLVGRDPEAEARRAASGTKQLPNELDLALAAYGAKRLVVGHTPSLKGIVISPDGRLARIDTGNSRFYGGPLSYLEILGDRMIPHTVRRSAP